MKTLLILRHARAENGLAGRDFERGLADKGRRDAATLGRELARRALAPDVVVASTAVRARRTAEIVVEEARWPMRVVDEPGIYEASCERLMAVVRGLPGTAAVALLVGHNPGVEDLAALLLPDERPPMPTTGLACLELETGDWAHATPACARLAWRWTPKD